MNNRRSASVGALPVEKKHFVSRNVSTSGAVLDVRCACQYFQCESLLPDKLNPVESQPGSKQGFLPGMGHGDHNHFDNTSTRSFNVMGGHTEFDRISTGSFGGRLHAMDGRGLIVKSILDANDPDIVDGMMVGFRGRQMSIDGMSSASFGGRDTDAVSIRSGISLRRVSKSPSQADLFVADLNIPLAHMPGQYRRGSRGQIPKFNIIAPTPSPRIGNMSPPDFSIYDRKSRSRFSQRNKENLSRHRQQVMPQNKPIDVSRYMDGSATDRSVNEPMDVDIEIIEAVVDIKDTIQIDRMSPPLEQNVPDLSPVVEGETRIEIRDLAPQPDLRPIDDILADEKPHENPSLFGQLKRQHAKERGMSPDYSKKQFMQSGAQSGTQSFQRASSPPLREMPHMEMGHMNQRASSVSPNGRQFGLSSSGMQSSLPSPNERQFGSSPSGMQSFQAASSPTSTGSHFGSPLSHLQSFGRSSSPSPNGRQFGSSPSGMQTFQRASSPKPTAGPYDNSLSGNKSFEMASSPAPNGAQHTDARQLMQYGPTSTVTQSFQRVASPTPTNPHGSQSFQRAPSPAPTAMQLMETRQLMQRGSPPSTTDKQYFQRASSPAPIEMHRRASSPAPPAVRMDTNHPFQKAPSSHTANTRQFMQRGSPSAATQTLQKASCPVSSNSQHVDKPHGDKQSYSSRFMSMFHTKTPDSTAIRPEKQKLTLSQHFHIGRERSPSPAKLMKPEPSPTPSRLLSVFKHEKHEQSPQHATAMTVVEGSNIGNVIPKKGQEEKHHTIKVTETFSLKVDEMDQYSSHPPKSPSPVRQSHLHASSEHIILAQDRLSESADFYGDRHVPFAPIIVPSAHSSQVQLQAGDRNQYKSASQADLRSSRRFDSHEHISPTPHATTLSTTKKLISVPIAVPADFYDYEMTSSEFIQEEPEDWPNYSPSPRTNLIKAPSEQRLTQSKLLQRKAHASERTQSQDRAAALDLASELDTHSISTRSMTKTVSFNFGERDSRLNQHEKMVSSNNQLEKGHWLERTYFSR